jgi:hypothetical protein
MYLWAREWGIQPGQFWDMTIPEWWLEYDLKAPKDPAEKYAGKLTRADIEELKAFIADDSG